MQFAMDCLILCGLLVAVITLSEGNIVDDVFGTEIPDIESTESVAVDNQSDAFKSIIASHLFSFIFGKNAYDSITKNVTLFPVETTTYVTDTTVGPTTFVTDATVESTTHVTDDSVQPSTHATSESTTHVTDAVARPTTYTSLTTSVTTSFVPSSTESSTESYASTTNPSTDVPDHADNSGGLGVGDGWLAAIIMAGVAGFIVFIFVVIFLYQKLERRRSASRETDPLLEANP